MSAAPGFESAAPRPRQVARTAPLRRPPLALVPPGAPRRHATRTPFAAVVVALLVSGLLGLLVLNTALAQDAFLLHTLKQDSRALQDREQVLTREVEALRAPQALAERAGALGMVPAGPPAFLQLPDGTVLGAETPAEAPVAEEAAGAEGAAEASVPTEDAAAAPDDAAAAPDDAAAAPDDAAAAPDDDETAPAEGDE